MHVLKFFTLIALGSSAVVSSTPSPARASDAAALALPNVLTQAEGNNPDLKGAYQTWQVKRAEIGPAGVWENPTFSFVDERFPSGTPGVPTERIRHYRLEQAIPFPGKLTRDSRMKFHEALIAEADYRAKRLELLRDVRMRFYQIYLTDQKVLLALESVDILKDGLRIAQGRVSANQASASDIFMAQTELGKMKNDLFQAQQERLLVAIELNTLLNQSIHTSLGEAAAPSLAEIPLQVSDLEMLAHRNDPSYLTAIHELDHAQAMLKRNRLNFAPDFGVMFERETSPDGPAGRQIGVSISFPLWVHRPWAQYKAAKEHLTEAQAKSQAMRNDVDKMLNIEFVETNTHLGLARNYEDDILPLASSSVKIARQQYASGQGDFMRVLEAFRSWVEAHNQYEEQLYHYAEHWSELERWTGVSLDHAKESLEKNQAIPLEMHHAN